MTGSVGARRARRAVLGALALTGGLLGVGMTAAGAAPSGPNATTGTFMCPGGSGTFVAPGTSQHSNATSFGAAHLTFASGETAIFVPSAFDFTFSFPGGSQSFSATKGSGSEPSPDTCSIFASFPIPGPGGGTATLSGTVSGKIVVTG
jgi:hypothetical protein